MKKLWNKKYAPFFVLLLMMILLHLLIQTGWGDEVNFKNYLKGTTILEYMQSRYSGWSSRILIEIVLIGLLQLPKIIWVLLDSSMMLLLAYSISKLFNHKRKESVNWVICLLCLIYPFFDMCSAGWYATTLNYLWPLALGMFAMIPIKNAYQSKKEKKYMYPLYSLSLLFACNHEQMCAIIFCFYFLFIIDLWRKKKLTKFIIFQFFLALASFLFIILCPGNGMRKELEMDRWYPTYGKFHLVHKVYLGIVSMIAVSTFELNILLLILSVILLLVSIYQKKKPIWIFIASMPLMIISMFSVFPNLFASAFPGVGRVIDYAGTFTQMVPYIAFNQVETYMVLGLCLLLIGSITLTCYTCAKEKERLLIPLVALAGFASRIMMGFSPTVYASGKRTFLFLNFAFIILIIYFSKELIKNKKFKNIYIGILVALACMQLVNVLVL